METTLKLWYPNYQNNPGVLSKIIRTQIEENFQNFDVIVKESYFEGNETFFIDLEIGTEDYLPYVTSTIQKQYGKFSSITDLSEGDTILGRMQSPGKVGFGVFIDIGLRVDKKRQDCLIPLFQLREDFNEIRQSSRAIVKKFGLISGLPIEIKVLDLEDKTKIDVGLSQKSIDYYTELAQGPDKLIITKTMNSNVELAIADLDFKSYIDKVEKIDPLTSIIHCNSKTNGTGLIPKLGARMPLAPIGLIKSQK